MDDLKIDFVGARLAGALGRKGNDINYDNQGGREAHPYMDDLKNRFRGGPPLRVPDFRGECTRDILMTHNPENHHRHSIRMQDYDYANAGAYFVTLCTFDRVCYFDQFPQLRQIVINEWNNIPTRFHNVDLDEYVIMPNHFHGIIIVCRDTPYGYPNLEATHCVRPVNLGDIVGAFKSLCVNAWLSVIKTDNLNARGKFWQNNYYEHVIRNEDELNRIRQYIVNNPAQWEFDRENPMTNQQPPHVEKWMI